jgi:hypothetical protein
MNCRDIEFSTEKSQNRVDRALAVFDSTVLDRIMAFGLHLQGARRKDIASLLKRPEESVKTSIRVLQRDGLPAFGDRRYSDVGRVESMAARSLSVSTRREGKWQVTDFGVPGKELRIPAEHKIQLRTVLLSFLDSGLLSVQDTATALGLSEGHCRELGARLACADVEESLLDKRQGQQQDYLVTPEVKAELVQQFAVDVIARGKTSGEAISAALQERCQITIPARTVRHHLVRMGLPGIRHSLPELLSTVKKTSPPSS